MMRVFLSIFKNGGEIPVKSMPIGGKPGRYWNYVNGKDENGKDIGSQNP